MKDEMKQYYELRKLAEPIEQLTDLRAFGYSPAYINFVDHKANRTYDIPVPFLRALCAGLGKAKAK